MTTYSLLLSLTCIFLFVGGFLGLGKAGIEAEMLSWRELGIKILTCVALISSALLLAYFTGV